MTFLHPLALLGLLAATIPILLHILNLRRLRTIEFSTLRFLKEIQHTSIRKLQLKQILLLIVRTLLIVFLVFAFSRPTVQGTIPLVLAERAKTTAVIIFDDSYSMHGNDTYGTYISQAKHIAQTVLSSLNDGDEVVFLRLSECSSLMHPPAPQRDISLVRSFIDRIEPSAVYVPFWKAYRYAHAILSSSLNYNRELYIISDFQQGLFNESPLEVLPKLPDHTQVFAIVIGKHSVRNAAIESIELPSVIYHPQKPYVLRATVYNSGTMALRNHSVSVFQNAKRVAEKSIDIEAGYRRSVEFTLIPNTTGIVTGVVSLENDEQEIDNRSFFSITVPDRVHVCLVGTPQETRYIATALSVNLADSLITFDVTQTPLERLSTQHLLKAQVVLLVGERGLTPDRASMLASFVRRGNGLLYFPSTTPSIYATTFAIPHALTIPQQSIDINPSEETSKREFRFVDFQHPIFSEMFELESTKKKGMEYRTLEAPRIAKYVHLNTRPSTLTVVQLPTGSPFLTDDTLGKGHCLTVAVGATLEWSDFPLRGLFVPLIQRSTHYASQTLLSPIITHCGSTVTLPLPFTEEKVLRVITPDGASLSVAPQWLGNEVGVRFSQTSVPGIYTVHDKRRPLRSFAVNVDPREWSSPITPEKLRTVLEQYVHSLNQVHILKSPTTVQSYIVETRYGVELWSYFLVLALLCAFAEIVLAKGWNPEENTNVRT
ncbi:MAG: BatA domain-containing protein [Bacteroidetes bacterium]|nr:BatA domain-containing protein [Bacteroidota bacterium]